MGLVNTPVRVSLLALLPALVALSLLALAPGAAQGQDGEALPAELMEARKIFVKQTLIDPAIVSRFRSEVTKWDRLEVVSSEEEADIVATLSAEVEYTQTTADLEGAGAIDEEQPGDVRSTEALRPKGTVRVLEDIHLLITTPDGTELFRDTVAAGSLIGNSSRKLAKRLRKRIEDEEA